MCEIIPVNECANKLANLEREGISQYDRKLAVPEFDLTEKLKNDIDPNLTNKMFEKILRYLYTGNFRIPIDSQVIQTYNIFNNLKINEVTSALRSYMGTFLNPFDAYYIVEKAFKKGHMELYQTCLRLIGLHAGTIFTTDASLSFSFQLIKDCVLGDIEIDEQTLFQGIKYWIEHHAAKETESINDVQLAHESKAKFIKDRWKEIEEYIRWPLMSADFIFESVEPLNIISPYLLDEAYQHIALSNSKWTQYQGRGIRTKKRGGLFWAWSDASDRCNPSIAVSQRGTVIKKTTHSSHASVLGTKGFKSGNHSWKLKLNSPPHWIATGVCFKSQLTRDLTNDYSYMYGASSQNQLYQMSGHLISWNQNETIYCTLKIHGNTADFNIKTDGGTDISAQINMIEELVPISNLYTIGNELVMIK